MIILGGAGGVQYAHIFQRPPDIADQETGKGPEGGIEQTGLMSMGQIEGYMRVVSRQQICGEDNAFIEGKCGKESLHFPSFLDNVMVAIEQIQPVLLIKLLEKPEYIAVNVHDIFHAAVLPQFVSVSKFDIGKSLTVIMFQCGEIKVLVF
jgi:hypothetical protein